MRGQRLLNASNMKKKAHFGFSARGKISSQIEGRKKGLSTSLVVTAEEREEEVSLGAKRERVKKECRITFQGAISMNRLNR